MAARSRKRWEASRNSTQADRGLLGGEIKTSNNILAAVDNTEPTTAGKREQAGNKATLVFKTPEMNIQAAVRFGPVQVEKFIEFESEIVKQGPSGFPAVLHRPNNWVEVKEGGLEVPIASSQINYFTKDENGTLNPCPKLPKTNFIVIENRQKEECFLTGETGSQSLGTLVPVEECSDYATESVDHIWADGNPSAVLQVVEYLMKEKLAMFFPFSNGNGHKILTATAYPVNRKGRTYFLMPLNEGVMKLAHPVDNNLASAPEQKKVVIAPPRLKVRKI